MPRFNTHRAIERNTKMNDSKTSCESCTMPIESGQYCTYCSDSEGRLKPFDDRFGSMVSWTMREDSGLSRAEAEAKTLEFMGTLPAWRNHPDYIARMAKS